MRTLLLILLSIASACDEAPIDGEGTETGDCTDAADNDGDGLFDCADPGCVGASACGDFDGGPGVDASPAMDAGRDSGTTDGSLGSTADVRSTDAAGSDALVCGSAGWTRVLDFEELAEGEAAGGASGLDDPFDMVADTSVFRSGRVSARAPIEEGDTGWGRWGGVIEFPEQVREGGEVWFRTYFRYPAGYDFSAVPAAKLMRIYTSDGNISLLSRSGGRIDVDNVQDDAFFTDIPSSEWKALGTGFPADEWVPIEMYIRFSATRGVLRVWQGGELIFEDLEHATLEAEGSRGRHIYLYTYWNEGAPRTQHSYVDDIVVTTQLPCSVDARGNAFIGIE